MRLIAILAAVLTAGCSFAFVDGPPSPSCTTHSAAPAVDGVAAVILGLAVFGIGLAASAYPGFDCQDDCNSNPITGAEVVESAAAALLVAAPFAISGVVGVRRMEACRTVKTAELEEPLRGNPGHPCRRDGSCSGDAICRAGSCAVTSPGHPLLPIAGEPCRRDPEIPVGICAAGLACVAGRCASP